MQSECRIGHHDTAQESAFPRNMTPNTDREKEWIRQIEEERKASKGLQVYYYEKRSFSGSFESNWHMQLIDFVDNCSHWNIPDQGNVLLVRNSWKGNSDARQCYDNIMTQTKIANMVAT